MSGPERRGGAWWQLAPLVFAALVAPVAGAAGPRVAVISDLNGDYGSTRYETAVDDAVARIVELAPQVVISTGDMVAGQRRPHLARAAIEAMWTAFHEHVTAPLAAAGIPLLVTPGNHDASAYAGFALERTIYAEQWVPRRPAVRFVDDGGYPFDYAVAVGETLLIGLDVTTVGHLSERQMTWLARLLERDGAEFSARVVFAHLPVWPFAQGREEEFIGDPALQRLLAEEHVALFLSGHHHAFYPGVHGGVAFVGQGCLGAGPRPLIGQSVRSPRSFTLLDFTTTPIGVAAYDAPRFAEPRSWDALPRAVHGATVVLRRADLVEGAPIAPAAVPR